MPTPFVEDQDVEKWKKIESEFVYGVMETYEEDGVTIEKKINHNRTSLSKKWKVNRETLTNVAKRNDWDKKRAKYKNDTDTKKSRKMSTKQANLEMSYDKELIAIGDKIMRGLTKRFDAETYGNNQKSGKDHIDAEELRDLVASMKNLTQTRNLIVGDATEIKKVMHEQSEDLAKGLEALQKFEGNTSCGHDEVLPGISSEGETKTETS